jgi:hypothetical protein
VAPLVRYCAIYAWLVVIALSLLARQLGELSFKRLRLPPLAGRAPNLDYRKHGGIAAIASQRPAAGTHKFTAGVHGGRFNSVRDTDA